MALDDSRHAPLRVMKHTGASYDGRADLYADANEDKPINVYLQRPALVSLLPPLSGTSVLDAGCGPGWFAEHCQSAGAAITAFDFNADFVGCCSRPTIRS